MGIRVIIILVVSIVVTKSSQRRLEQCIVSSWVRASGFRLGLAALFKRCLSVAIRVTHFCGAGRRCVSLLIVRDNYLEPANRCRLCVAPKWCLPGSI